MIHPELFKRELIKPGGRDLTLYSRRPISAQTVPTEPAGIHVEGRPHLRWHPLREEWVAFASHRQNRTFLPPKEYNPLAQTKSVDFPTELPAGEYDIAVFDNLFASLQEPLGHCEVVVFTRDADTSLGKLPLPHIQLLLDVWADRYAEIARKKDIKYILPFENRGVEVGVTLHHPHGQIYSYPFIPPLQQAMLRSQRKFFEQNKITLLSEMIKTETLEQQRIVHRGKSTLAFIPPCARYPYEVWIAPERNVSSLAEMTAEETADFAAVLKTVLLKYDGLWKKDFPYLMALYAAPTDGEPHPEWHFHIEFYPPYRTRDRLKFLAGTELAAGMFVNDSLPEEKAAELRAVEVQF